MSDSVSKPIWYAEQPQAFPSQWALGMDLRDWFAGQAMAALIERYVAEGGDKLAHVAIVSYQIADSLMTERTRGAHE